MSLTIDINFRDDADWKESQHPRAKGGEFTNKGTGVGKQTHPHAQPYKKTLKYGSTGTVAGLINHLIMTGEYSANDIFKIAHHEYDIPESKKAYINACWKALNAKGKKPPLMPGLSKTSISQAEKKVEVAKSMNVPEPKKPEPTPEPMPEPAKKQEEPKQAGVTWTQSEQAKAIIAPLLAAMNENKLLPKNAEAIQGKIAELGNTNGDKEKLAKVEPLNAVKSIAASLQSHLSVVTFNSYLAQLKSDASVKMLEAEKPEPMTPKQKMVYRAVKAAPHHESEHIYNLPDRDNNKMRSRLKVDTKNIGDDGYAKVTSAYTDDIEASVNSASVNDAMEDYQNFVFGKLSNNERQAADYYKGSGYKPINQHLLGDKDPDSNKYVKDLSIAVNKFAVPADTPVWRGLRSTLKQLTGFSDPTMAVGRCFEHKNFASMSRDRAASMRFGDTTMLHVVLPAGTPGLVLGHQKGSSEKEIVLDYGSVFRVDRVEHDVNNKFLVHCTFIGKREKK